MRLLGLQQREPEVMWKCAWCGLQKPVRPSEVGWQSRHHRGYCCRLGDPK